MEPKAVDTQILWVSVVGHNLELQELVRARGFWNLEANEGMQMG